MSGALVSARTITNSVGGDMRCAQAFVTGKVFVGLWIISALSVVILIGFVL